MALTVSTHVHDEVKRLVEAGRTVDGWKVLAANGDQYAKVAVHVLSFEWSRLNCVRAEHWRLTVPQHPLGGDVWTEISNLALRNYLRFMEENQKRHLDRRSGRPAIPGKMPLPDTKEIESCYMAAVAEVNKTRNAAVSQSCIIHLAGNRFTTPLNTKIEHAFRTAAHWAGPLRRTFRRFTMPDWENVVNRDFGSLDSRQRHDSEHMAPDTYLQNAWILTRSITLGLARYREGQLHLRPRQIVPAVGAGALTGD